ncbi:DsbC/DsbD-like thiol-disulfide interchange protein/cytochrome c biogenesis protein CcdA [Sphingomonas sp. F9_3S_D5_B_2]
MLRRLLILLGLLLSPALLHARGIEPELVAEGAAPPGGEVELALRMHPAEGWHGYWLNPGDAGLPMQVEWHLPPGFSVGELRYPVPSRLQVAGLMNYVYERDYAVLVRLKVPAGAHGAAPIRAEAQWLACTDKVCVPERGTLSLDLPVGSGTLERAQFDRWRKALPRPLASVGHFAVSGDKLRVAIPLPASVAAAQPYLFPATDGPVDYGSEQSFSRSGDTFIAELKRRGTVPMRFAGVLALGPGQGLQFEAVPGLVPQAERAAHEQGAKALLFAVLGALLGGILLNLMPCVFPILALKVLHLSRAGGSARSARTDALSYAAGTAVGTGLLGVALLAIRAAGVQAGWAFQLQDPRTVMLLLLLATAITANLLGLFELPVIGGRLQPAGSFGTGALAAFVATPCAGPFLGTALGAALLLPVAGGLLVFVALGLGLALPFAALAFLPRLQRVMPKPGRWMRRLQQVLAIPMAASAVAALWLLGRQTGQSGLVLGTLAALGILLLLAGLGFVQRRGLGSSWLAAALAVAVALFVVWQVPGTITQHSSAIAGAEPWTAARAASYAARGQRVFVYFTADWCLTCKANEAAAIDRDEVRKAFAKSGVKVLAGDWTDGDPEITRFLESRGRAGVPFYLWYAPGKPPEELPQVLTQGMLISRAQAR